MTDLSPHVVETDHRLDTAATKSSEALAKHRWHWTLDETNPDRVSIREYGRAVGKSDVTIGRYVRGYDAALATDDSASDVRRTLTEHIERAAVGVEKEAAVEAVAKARGVGFRQARQARQEEVRQVRTMAQDRAERRGTTVPEELPQAAQDVVRAEQTRNKQEAKRKEAIDPRFFGVEKHLASAKASLMSALKESEGVEFTEEHRQLMAETLQGVRSLLDLVDLRVSGSADVDWDAELAKLGAS